MAFNESCINQLKVLKGGVVSLAPDIMDQEGGQVVY